MNGKVNILMNFECKWSVNLFKLNAQLAQFS